MALKLFNTLTKQMENFCEIEPGIVKLYTCGPTVYDYAHIGNFRSYVVEDLIKRTLLALGYRVKHVMNITDIDDKTIRKANQTGKTLAEITGFYTEAFFKDLQTLNILPADIYPRATEHIPEMISLIKKLLEKGYAYEKDGSVYFSISRFPDYGILANIKPEQLKIGLAVDVDEYEKDAVQDFVLWKKKKDDEPFWQTEIGEGRPGWHIECSAMSMKYLGETFDIHMGGVDNIFPHHVNEIAQSEAATGKKFVNYWLHCQHLIVEGKKMSKSLGNFYTLHDLLKENHSPAAIRFLLLSAHYRKSLNFTLQGLSAASKSVQKLQNFLFFLKINRFAEGDNEKISLYLQNAHKKFLAALEDDFNISEALAIIFTTINFLNQQITGFKSKNVQAAEQFLKNIDQVLGVLDWNAQPPQLSEEQQELIRRRQEARNQKNFSLADQIRLQLNAENIEILDTPTGSLWKPKDT